MERLIKASSVEGNLVLDPLIGVGTCPAVCRRFGRHFIGFEKNKHYVEAANARLREVENDLVKNLFF